MIYEPTAVVIAASEMSYIDQWVELNNIQVKEKTPLAGLVNDGSSDQIVEFAGRHCYRSWDKGRPTDEYIKNILEQGHGSVLEHANISVAISGISRSCSHEIVRHRAGFAYSQESQRYVDCKDIDFVIPPAMIGSQITEEAFRDFCVLALDNYDLMQKQLSSTDMPRKRINEAARAVLPNATETRMVMTGNLRAWRHFFEMRGSPSADAEIRRLAVAIFEKLEPIAPYCFADFKKKNDCLVNKYKKV